MAIRRVTHIYKNAALFTNLGIPSAFNLYLYFIIIFYSFRNASRFLSIWKIRFCYGNYVPGAGLWGCIWTQRARVPQSKSDVSHGGRKGQQNCVCQPPSPGDFLTFCEFHGCLHADRWLAWSSCWTSASPNPLNSDHAELSHTQWH